MFSSGSIYRNNALIIIIIQLGIYKREITTNKRSVILI